MSDDPRHAYRQGFVNAWRKHQQHQPLTPLEQQLVAVIAEHPEVIAMLERGTEQQPTAYAAEENPYIHLSLHLALRDQIQLDHPAGVRAVYTQLQRTGESTHNIEHRMMDVLAATLWGAYRQGQEPSVTDYLQQLQALLETDHS